MNIIFFLILIRPIVSIFSGIIPYIGEIHTLITLLILTIEICKNRIIEIKYWALIILSFLIFLLDFTNEYSFNFASSANDFLNYILFILLLLYITNLNISKMYKSYLARYFSYIDLIIKVISIILLINLASSGMSNGWGISTFKGVFKSEHMLVYFLILVSSITILLDKYRGKIIYKFFIFEYIFFAMLSGARTGAIALLIIIFSLYELYRFKKFKFIFLLGIILLLLFPEMIFNNPIVKKFQLSVDSISGISNGRFDLWITDINHFFASNIKNILVGNGASFPIKLHLMNNRVAIWSHNDILQILIGNGLIGVITYLSIWKRYVKRLYSNKNKITILFLLVSIILLIMFNGLYIYKDATFALVYISLLEE